MPIISVKNLSRNFKSYKKEPGVMGSIKSMFHREYTVAKAVDTVSFSIEEGELIGFIGPNGAGKTTTLKCLSGLLHPSSGEVKVLGFTPFNRENNFLKQIALVMGQKTQLWADLPSYDSFLLNKEIYEIPENKFKQVVNELAELLEVTELLKIQVRKLSLGQRMKCELIGALIHSPKILFLDEPTIGLDVVMQEKLRSFIKQYNQKYNSTILLTSHYMKDVQELCQRVVIINQGIIVYDGNLSDIVKKYGTHKIISATLHTHIATQELEKFGELKEYDYPKFLLEVPKDESNSVASHLLQNFPLDDFNILEPDIESIIRDLFNQSKHL